MEVSSLYHETIASHISYLLITIVDIALILEPIYYLVSLQLAQLNICLVLSDLRVLLLCNYTLLLIKHSKSVCLRLIFFDSLIPCLKLIL